MLVSKSLVSVLLGSMLSLVLAGCSLPKSQQVDDNTDTASFTVTKVTTSTSEPTNDEIFSLPVSRSLNFTACVTDNNYSKAIRDHKFEIQGGNTDPNPVLKTDSDGCLNWQETLNYNGLADAAYVKLTRKIQARGVQHGAARLNFAVNPWSGDIVYLKEKTVPGLIEGDQVTTALQSPNASRPVWVPSLNVTVTPRYGDQGPSYHFEVQAEPKVQRKKASGDTETVSLTAGQFTAKMYLIRVPAINADTDRKIIAETNAQPVTLQNQSVIGITSDFKLDTRCSLGSYEVALDLTPVASKNVKGLTAMHGVYPVGTCESLTMKKTANLKDDPLLKPDQVQKFDISKYAKDITGMGAAGAVSELRQGTASDSSAANALNNGEQGVIVGNINLEPIQIKNELNTVTTIDNKTKRIRYMAWICASTADNKPLAGFKLKVTGVSGALLDVTTQPTGCGSFYDTFDIDYYQQCIYRREIIVASKELGINGIHRTIKIQPNEYNYNFTDVTAATGAEHDAANNCTAGQSSMIASTYSIDNVSNSYDVDENLGLKIIKNGVLNLSIHLNQPNYTNLTGPENQNLPVGNYKLRWAVVDSELQNYEQPTGGLIYAAGEQVVAVNSLSAIQQQISIGLTNIKSVGNTNYILFELSPLDGEVSKNLKITTMRAPITLADDVASGNITLLPSNNILPNMQRVYAADQVIIKKSMEAKGTKTAYVANNNIELYNLDSMNELPFDVTCHTDLLAKLWGSSNMWVGQVCPKKPLDKSMVSNWISSGRFDSTIASNLCVAWAAAFNKAIPRDNKRLQNLLVVRGKLTVGDVPVELRDLVIHCMQESEKNPRTFFNVEYRYMLSGAAHMTSQQGVVNDVQNININDNYTLTRSYAVNDVFTQSHDVALGFSVKTEEGFSASGGWRWQWSKSQTDSSSTANSQALQRSHNTLLESVPVNLQVPDYEKCVQVKLNPSALLDKDTSGSISERFTTEAAAKKFADRGWMFCPGHNEGHALNFQENYYVMHQVVHETEITKGSSAADRGLFLDFRGRGDLATMMSFLIGNMAIPDSYRSEFQKYEMLTDDKHPLYLQGFRTSLGQFVDSK